MSQEEKSEGTMPSPVAEARPKRSRKVRAIFLLLPPEAQIGELVRLISVSGKKEARKALEKSGVDVTNYAEQVKLVRGEYMPLAINKQVVFKF